MTDRDTDSLGDPFSEAYDEVRAIAAHYLRQERRRNHTLHPTDLVHEVFLRLQQSSADDLPHGELLAAASRSTRRILVDHARRKKAAKRGGDWTRITLSEGLVERGGVDTDLLDLDEAMDSLAAFDEHLARVVELRFFCGLTNEEVGRQLGVTRRIIDADWALAKAWLKRELGQG